MAKVRTRKRGKTYSYIFEAGKTLAGKRKVVEKGGFATEDEAYDAGVDAYADWKHGNIGITSDKVTFEVFANNWLENFAKLNVSAHTFHNYTHWLNLRIIPALGNYTIQNVTPTILEKFIQKITQEGLAKETLAHYRSLIYQIFQYAIHPCQLIANNPIEYVKIPKNAPEHIIKRTIIDSKLYNEFLQEYPYGKSPYYIPTVLMYHTGMRISEALGLAWDNVDLDAGKIFVKEQLVYLPELGYHFKSPKTKTSTRTIYIDDQLISILRQWKDDQRTNELSLGDVYCAIYERNDHTVIAMSKNLPSNNFTRRYLVCTTLKGRFICYTTVKQIYRKFGINAHSFRHTHATMLIESGAPLKGVAGRLGHKHLNTTDLVYTHNTPKLQLDTLKTFADTIADKNYHADNTQTNAKL